MLAVKRTEDRLAIDLHTYVYYLFSQSIDRRTSDSSIVTNHVLNSWCLSDNILDINLIH